MMNNTKSVKQYDLFKLIVAIVLLLIFLCLFLWAAKPNTTPPLDVTPLSTLTLTSAPATQAFTATSTIVPPPTNTQTSLPVNTPTNTPVPTTTTTPSDETNTDVSVCEAIAKSQLAVGMTAIINQRLNFRSSPGIYNNRISTSAPGTKAEIIGGPTCTTYKNRGVYLWWQIKLPNGLTGWSAEASIYGTFYFMGPVK